jgi:hypothetical protein
MGGKRMKDRSGESRPDEHDHGIEFLQVDGHTTISIRKATASDRKTIASLFPHSGKEPVERDETLPLFASLFKGASRLKKVVH